MNDVILALTGVLHSWSKKASEQQYPTTVYLSSDPAIPCIVVEARTRHGRYEKKYVHLFDLSNCALGTKVVDEAIEEVNYRMREWHRSQGREAV